MAILLLGVVLWTVVHLYPSLAPAQRAAFVKEYGEKPVKGAVAMLLIIALALIVIGWQRMFFTGGNIYFPPRWGWHLNNLLMLVAFVLLGAGHSKSNIRRFIRHPMLTAVILWAVAHLLANGETRSVILFGGMLVWAVLAIVLINRRDGAWVVPPPSPRRTDLIHLGVSVVLFLVVAFIHPWLFGVSPWPV